MAGRRFKHYKNSYFTNFPLLYFLFRLNIFNYNSHNSNFISILLKFLIVLSRFRNLFDTFKSIFDTFVYFFSHFSPYILLFNRPEGLTFNPLRIFYRSYYSISTYILKDKISFNLAFILFTFLFYS